MSHPTTPANIDAVQRMLAQLRLDFLEEMQEKLNRLENLLLEMEKKGGGERFEDSYRIVHSLKGSGGTHGLHIITTICHQLEDMLNTTGNGTKFTPPLIASGLSYVDLLHAASEQIQAGKNDFAAIEDRLDKLRKQLVSKLHTVMLVDNSKLVTSICLGVLSEMPARIVVMNDAPIALIRLLTEPFDMLITSDELPVLSGTALIGALKLSSSRNRSITTILLSSHVEYTSNRKRATDADLIVVKNPDWARYLSEVTGAHLKSEHKRNT